MGSWDGYAMPDQTRTGPRDAGANLSLNDLGGQYFDFVDRSNYAVDTGMINAGLTAANIGIGLGKLAANRAKEIGRATVYGTDDWTVGSGGYRKDGTRREVTIRGKHTPGYIAGPTMAAQTAWDFLNPVPQMQKASDSLDSLVAKPTIGRAGKFALDTALAYGDAGFVKHLAESGLKKAATTAITHMGRY